MKSIFKNVLLGSLILTIPMMSFAEEVKPFEYIKNKNGYPENIAMYKIKIGFNWLFIRQYPFLIENYTNDANFKSQIDAQCENLEQIYQQNSKVFIVTSTCGAWYGVKSNQEDYFIHEFNGSAKFVKTTTINFDGESFLGGERNIYIKELQNGIRIETNKSARNGKKYIYEYKNGKLYDYSTMIDPLLVAKEEERKCKGFFNMFRTTNKEQNLTGELYSILSGAEYSWVSHKVKTDDFLSDQLASLIKVTSINQRKNIKYSDFKGKYCD